MALPIPISSPGGPLPDRGLTKAGEEIAIYYWYDLEPLSSRSGTNIRAYCPKHHSDHQRSLSINASNGWGQCFGCKQRVLIRDWNPRLASALVRHAHEVLKLPALDCSARTLRALPPTSPDLSKPKRPAPAPKAPGLATVQPWQEEERRLLHTLQAEGALRLERPEAWNAQAYLAARHIPLEIALTAGVGYLEPGASERYQQKLLRRWEDRLVFPLQAAPSAAAGGLVLDGYAGRLLSSWQYYPDEVAHKKYLEQQDKKRWIKTNPAWWFWDPIDLPQREPVVVVEGPLDRLAVLASGGFQPGEILALVGTALQSRWLAGKIRALLLALDADQAGHEASDRIARDLAFDHLLVESCVLPADGAGGKDWSERWRRRGDVGMQALYVSHALLAERL
ncbi:toprim domain-containing protein [Dictyobacter formicarum]|uniref:Toprim domain-containing protein n=1 Tax=Dictyobacter formicarum TaxID=2778368 RepID=A0ABQ3VR81_9CHLR|nr:toprim domain-containing protein [Dictyobacter formicarum]GHO88221.1 hypothetical protein KSZ_62270 [Dictyobacter formicarum]